MNILLLEDDLLLSETIMELLIDDGHSVVSTEDGYDAEELMIAEEFDLYLLDINVKGWNGFKLAEYIRSENDETPIIFITAINDIASIKKAYNIGITDYLKKPFDPEELLLRIGSKSSSSNNSIKNVIEFSNIKFNIDKKELFINEKLVSLGKIETFVLDKILSNLNNIVQKEELMYITGNDNPNALRVLIKKIRDKTSINIENIRGKGYIINEH